MKQRTCRRSSACVSGATPWTSATSLARHGARIARHCGLALGRPRRLSPERWRPCPGPRPATGRSRRACGPRSRAHGRPRARRTQAEGATGLGHAQRPPAARSRRGADLAESLQQVEPARMGQGADRLRITQSHMSKGTLTHGNTNVLFGFFWTLGRQGAHQQVIGYGGSGGASQRQRVRAPRMRQRTVMTAPARAMNPADALGTEKPARARAGGQVAPDASQVPDGAPRLCGSRPAGTVWNSRRREVNPRSSRCGWTRFVSRIA
ncbi:hypothetical protein EES39_33425 [Streptomyces sp. ADI92-24]|nr:hypothetical protein EES39_33425 [Streptomyces sp. ADI92-24]